PVIIAAGSAVVSGHCQRLRLPPWMACEHARHCLFVRVFKLMSSAGPDSAPATGFRGWSAYWHRIISGPAIVGRGEQKMARTVDGSAGGTGFAGLWTSDIGPTLSLGLPIVGAQLAQIAINTTDVVMIGWLGATELAAAVLAFNLYILFWLFGMGLLHAVVPLAAKARGERKPRELRRSVRMGFWIVALYCLPVWVVLWQTEALLLLLRQDPEVSSLAGGYMRLMQWSMLTSLGVMAVRNFVSVMGRTQIILTTTVAGAVLNGVLD